MKHLHKLLILLLLSSPALALYAGPKLGPIHRNDTYHYFLKVPQKWKALPVDPREKYVIDKLQSHLRDSNGILSNMEIMVFNTTKIVVTDNTGISFGEDNKPTKTLEELRKEWSEKWEEENRLTSFDAMIKQQREMKSSIEVLKRYEIPWKKAKNGKAQVYELGYASGHNAAFGMIACSYRRGNVEYVVQYTLNRKDLDDAKEKDVYINCFKTFSLSKNATGVKKKVLDITKLPPHKRRAAAKKGLPKGWYAVDTANYVIITNVKKKKFIKEIAAHLELIRKKYEEMFPPKKKIEALSVVRICGNRDEYMGYGAPPGSAGYFSPMSKEMVLYDDSKRNKKNTFSVLYHECFHQYTFYFFGKLSAHRWYDEGLGDYFAGAKLKEGKFKIGKFDWRTETIRNAFIENKNYPIEKFVRLTQPEYYSDASVCYSQGWAFIYFLKHTRNPRWKKIINIYIEKLAETKDAKKAVDAAFEGINYKKIDKAFANFVGDGFKIK